MTATFALDQQYGAATGSPAGGTSTTTSIANANWANSSDPTIAYTTNPITAGNNSFDIWIYGHFSGSFNQIGPSGLFAHTATAMGTGQTIKGTVTSSYTTPAATANANLTTDMTAAIAIGSGLAVLFGATSPQAAGKATTTTANPAFSQFLATQLQTTVSSAAGDTPSAVMTISYQENLVREPSTVGAEVTNAHMGCTPNMLSDFETMRAMRDGY